MCTLDCAHMMMTWACRAQSGRLPDQMILDSRDEGWFSDGDEDAAAPEFHPGDYSFPLTLGKTLTGDCICSAKPRMQSRHNESAVRQC